MTTSAEQTSGPESKNVYFDKYDNGGAYHWEECNRKSPNYNPPLEARYQVIIDHAQSLPTCEDLLDVGCGDGYLLAKVSPWIERGVGIDTEAKGVALANECLVDYARCEAIQASCYEIPYEPCSFDVVLSTDVIEHLTDADGCVREMARILRDNGVLLLTTPKWRPDRKWDHRHVKEYTSEELREVLEVGFDSIEISYFWPLAWSNYYNTKLGWHMTKRFARYLYNPFMRTSSARPEKFGQLFAVCRGPKRHGAGEPSGGQTE